MHSAICSKKYTSQPSRLKPRGQLRRVHAAPPLPGLLASAPATTIKAIDASAQVQLPCKRFEHFRRVEVRLGELAGGTRVMGVVARDRARRVGGLIDCLER